MDTIIANALRIKYLRDLLLGKAKESVMRATGGNYPAPLKVCFHYLRVITSLKMQNENEEYLFTGGTWIVLLTSVNCFVDLRIGSHKYGAR